MLKSAGNHFDVIVVGAGFAGLYLVYRLRELGLSVRVLERGGGIGGTWYWNRYPGARCDIESMQYSYQFSNALQQQWEWSERYASQPEILAYAEHVAERFRLHDHIQLDTEVRSAKYHGGNNRWLITTTQGKSFSAGFLVFATGCLSRPNWPRVSGLSAFAGNIYHTATWPHKSVDFSGRHVAVIGTGSSAIQLIPKVAEQAASLRVFQRTANYSIPGHNAALDPDAVRHIKANYNDLRARAQKTPRAVTLLKPQKLAAESTREQMINDFEWRWQYGGLGFLEGFSDIMLNPDYNDIAAQFVRDKICAIVRDEKTARLLCPTNIIGGKRLCVDSHYFQTYNKPGVELVDVKSTPIDSANERGLQIGDTFYALDDIIIATGFDAITGALMNIDIVGNADISLQELWSDGPKSYLGLAMSGFPNLFTVTGPGSPSVLTNMLCSIEQHVDWITACLTYMDENQYSRIEASSAAETRWWAQVQSLAADALKSKTASWYMGSNIDSKANVFMPYLGGYHRYTDLCRDIVKDQYRGFEFR